MKKSLYLFLTFIAAIFVACSSGAEPVVKSPDASAPAENGTDTHVFPAAEEWKLCKGADISWLTEMEGSGVKFYYDNGIEGDCIDILKSKGINAMRLRVWVNPPNGYCGMADVLAKAKRISSAGLDLMIDFHYSDSWTDPGQQTVPKEWEGEDAAQLAASITDFTTASLQTLKDNGIAVKWVQVGNETGNGLLWPLGQADKYPQNYADFISAGYDAVKAVYSQAKVIVHLQNGQDNGLFRWNFDILEKYGARYDVIGMSLYPEPTDYVSMLAKCRANMADMVTRYGKDVMLCEVGMGEQYATECRDFLMRCLALESQIADARFLGVLYWEPQCYNDWNGYRKGAFTSQGRPGTQLDAFAAPDSSVPSIRL